MAGSGECEIEIIDLTESMAEAFTAELCELCGVALRAEHREGPWSITIVLTGDDHIAHLHEQFMGIAGPTDILTFASEDEPGGDIVISVDQADRQRHDDGWTLADELRFLVVHGALHLVGWDDATGAQRSAMLDRQRQIIDAFHADSSSTR